MGETVQKPGKSRFHDMDLARSAILISGVFFHAAFFYSIKDTWYASSSFKAPFFDVIITFVRTFRMESLFIVSGFFSAMLVTRSGSKGFVVNRFVRMGVPLIFCGLTFNTAMIYLADDSKEVGWTFAHHLLSGHWRAHLWNVGNLLGYESAVFSALWFLPSIHKKLAESRLVAWLAIPAYLGVGIVAYKIWEIAPHLQGLSILFHPQQMAMYVAAYLFGYVLHQNAVLRDNLFQPLRMVIAVVVLFFLRKWIGIHLSWFESLGPLVKAVDLAQHLARALLLFAVVRKFQTDNIWVKRLSLASYTIYILHMPLQIALFRLIDPVLPNLAGYALIASISLAVSWLVHVKVVERWGVVGFLMNGKVYKKETRSF